MSSMRHITGTRNWQQNAKPHTVRPVVAEAKVAMKPEQGNVDMIDS